MQRIFDPGWEKDGILRTMASFGRAVAYCIALSLMAGPIFAQTDEERDQARQLMDQGDELAEKKMHIEALGAYQKAHAIMNVPTTGIEVVRMLLSLGRLIEAKKVCRSVVALPVQPDEPTAFAEARTDASTLATELDARIPHLRVILPPSSRLYIDGAEVTGVRPGEPVAIDPGTHVVEARAPSKSVTKSVRVDEREQKTVDFSLPKPKPVAVPARQAPPRDEPRSSTTKSGPSTTRILGWTGIGVGGAGILFGAITGGLAIDKRSELDDGGCVDGSCPRGRASDVDSYNRLRTFSSLGLIGGAVLVTGGALLLGFGEGSSQRTGRTTWPGAAKLSF
jgi:hypothetical protein